VGFVAGTTPTVAPSKEPSPARLRKLVRTLETFLSLKLDKDVHSRGGVLLHVSFLLVVTDVQTS